MLLTWTSPFTWIAPRWTLSDWQVRANLQEYQHSANQLCILVYSGFDHEFNSLQSKEDEFGTAFSLLTQGAAPTDPSYRTIRLILMAIAPMILKLVRVPPSSSPVEPHRDKSIT